MRGSGRHGSADRPVGNQVANQTFDNRCRRFAPMPLTRQIKTGHARSNTVQPACCDVGLIKGGAQGRQRPVFNTVRVTEAFEFSFKGQPKRLSLGRGQKSLEGRARILTLLLRQFQVVRQIVQHTFFIARQPPDTQTVLGDGVQNAALICVAQRDGPGQRAAKITLWRCSECGLGHGLNKAGQGIITVGR